MYVCPCIIYENDERYQLDAATVIYYHKYLYMFRASICPSSGVQVVCCCIWCSALGVVAVVLRGRCVVLCSVCKFVSWRWAYRCPKHVEIFMIINHNCCIKLVPFIIYFYDKNSSLFKKFICRYLPIMSSSGKAIRKIYKRGRIKIAGRLFRYSASQCVFL